MWNILSFNNFIAQNILILFYYIGAVLIPAVLYYYRNDAIKYLNKKEKIALIVLIISFFCMELFWRMIFEAMIGYFDIHDYLYEISKRIIANPIYSK